MKNLFIYIPTYNRPEALRTQLSALIPQVLSHTENVRLLVCDNNSDKYKLNEILADYPESANIQSRINGGNIGGNANIALAFVFAKPHEFVWILSDNDIVSEDAVTYILSKLDSDVDFFCFVDNTDIEVDIHHDWKLGWQIPMNWRMGKISDALYNMNSIKSAVDDAFYFHNSSFPHLAVACAAAKKKGLTRFRLLPRHRIQIDEASSLEQPGDYSLSQVCMPLLIPLFPKWEAKSFAITWLWKHGITFHEKRHRHPHLYIQSTSTLRHYGGWRTLLLMHSMYILAVVKTKYFSDRPMIVQKIKNILSRLNS
jgi:glycosyltransferase involved in cell wall biosynthesis